MRSPQDPIPHPLAALIAAALEQTHDQIALFDRSGRLLCANAVAEPSATYLAPPEARAEAERTGRWVGKRVEGDRTLSVAVTPVRDRDGTLTHFLACARDITPLAEHLDHLERAAQRWSMANIACTDGVWDQDILAETAYLSPNAKALLGYADDEFPNDLTAWREQIHPDDRPGVFEALRQVQCGETDQYAIEYRIRCKKGEFKRLLARGRAVFDEEGQHIRSLGFLTDLTPLRAAEARLQQITDTIDDIITLHDERLGILYATPSIRRLEERPTEAFLHRSILDWAHPDDHRAILHARKRLRHHATATIRWRHAVEEPARRWFETTVRHLDDETWRPARYLCSTREITAQVAADAQVRWQACHDPLTGLVNRAHFLARTAQSIARTRPGEKKAVLFVDLDGFKRINDTLGHAAGDALLQTIAARLTDATRGNDIQGRLGGDEFTVLLTSLSHRDDPLQIARRLIEAVSQPVRAGGHEIFVTASVGIALYPDDGADAETLLRHADMAMYQAKQLRNEARYYHASMHDTARDRLRHEQILRHALDRNEFALHFQPQVNVQTGRTAALEALLRWNPPPGEMPLAPPHFIALAEETGLIDTLGGWILQTACQCAVAWRRVRPDGPRVAVNVSAQQLARPSFLGQVEEALAASGLPPSCLEFELTEAAFLGKAPESGETLQRLRALGARLLIDDFGTGYSSLSYLCRLPLDGIKIDASFFHDLTTSPRTQEIVRSLIGLAHALDLEVVAEGVEDALPYEILTALGCDRVQGYILSPALPADQIPDLLTALDAGHRRLPKLPLTTPRG